MKRNIITAIITILGFAVSSFATIINIPYDYPTIQQGIDASTDGDTVLVEPGMYVENINFNGHNIMLGSLFLVTGDRTYIAETIIDGNESGSVVTFESGENYMASIMGFSIERGLSVFGGGIFIIGSSPTITDNIIHHNEYNSSQSIILGGGIYCSNFHGIISRNIIYNNWADWGGGIHCRSGSNCSISYNIIYDNIASGHEEESSAGGGGICIWESSALIEGNLIYYNGAFAAFGVKWGGGLLSYLSEIVLINNIVFQNTSDYAQFDALEEIYNYCGDITVRNTIIWSEENTIAIFIDGYGDILIEYCDVINGWEGQSNIDADPLFRDPENGDFHLMSIECGDSFDSPCIDTGDPSIEDILLDCSWGLGTILSDMGAYGGADSAMVDIDNSINQLPEKFLLMQNYPNPFNPSTTIRYSLPAQSDVCIEIYNILGQKVATLFDGNKQAGYHTVSWQADRYPSGVYFARLKSETRSESIKMVLLK